MEINKEKAIGIKIVGEDFTYVKAVRKPDSDCKIVKEIWFKGSASRFQKKKS